MMYSGPEENNELQIELIEKDGRGFKLKRFDPFGHWKIFHAKNNMPVMALPGEYTSLEAAKKAVINLPEENLPPRSTHGKVVLTPKLKKEAEENDD